ncbi:hypothetical protein DBIPINDM_007987 (plasmid) [Mesorhizobium sp. AR02]|nr:hypothetical protein DBIPINDM_007987 [Mesorhizobium sp. AR02]
MLRIGYLALPPDLLKVFAIAKQLLDRLSRMTEQQALASLIEGGAYGSQCAACAAEW